MKILLISDTHGKHRDFEKKFPFPWDCDMILCAGDITSRGEIYEVNDFLNWFSELKQFEHKIFIAGNHDFLFERDVDLAKSIIPNNVIYLENSEVKIDGIKFWGSPITPQFYNWAFNRDRGKDIKKYWDIIPDDVDVLITHGPPFGILDFVDYNQEHVGCQDLLIALNRIRPKYHIFGHIHESYGIWETDTSTFLNVSSLNGRYVVKNTPQIINI